LLRESVRIAHSSILASRFNLVWALFIPTAGVEPVDIATWVICDFDRIVEDLGYVQQGPITAGDTGVVIIRPALEGRAWLLGYQP